MNPTYRFLRVIAAALVCALCWVMADFRVRGEAADGPGAQRPAVDANSKKESTGEPFPATAIPEFNAAAAKGSRSTAAAEAISQLAKSDDELMDSLRTRKPETGESTPTAPQPAGNVGPPPTSVATPTATGRHYRAVADSPAEQKLIEQIQSQESAAAELAAELRHLQSVRPVEPNQPAIDDSRHKLKQQLSTAFDLKLQLEELQVKELQSRLSRLERQIGQRRALRDKIIARRAAELLEDNGLQWDTSGAPPQPSPRSASGERQTSTPGPSPAVVKKLKRRAGLLIDGMKSGTVQPAAVLSALEDLKRIEPPPDAEWLELLEAMLETTEKLHAAGQISEAELLQIEAACDEARSVNERAVLPPKLEDFPPPKTGGRSQTPVNRFDELSTEPDPFWAKRISSSRPFQLRFKLASEMVDDLRQILLGRPGQEAKPSVDNQEVLVTAPPDVMGRVQTLISVMDWPEDISRGSNFEYPRDSVMRAARSFFYASAIEDDYEAFSKLLSLHVLAELKGDTKSDAFQKYLFGGAPDPEWEKTLRGDWPGKKEAIRRFVGEWNKYPLKRITEEDGVAIGFGAKHFCSVSLAGAPQEFYKVMIIPDRTGREGDKTLYFFSSLPPWWKSEKRTELPKTDQSGDSLEGVWDMVTPAGAPVEQIEDQRLRLVFASGWHATYRGTQRVSAFRLQVDAQQTPHRISLAGAHSMRGIYEIKDDGLRLSLAPATEALPTKFGTKHPEFKRVSGKLAEMQFQALKNMAER